MAELALLDKTKKETPDLSSQKENRFIDQENRTGIPAPLKERIERGTGLTLDDVRVHYNSSLPARLDALAYTKGNQVEIGPGQEKHLPHELGHVVQQKLGLVRANARHSSGEAMNTDERLERQADEIGSGRKIGVVQRLGEKVVQRAHRFENVWQQVKYGTVLLDTPLRKGNFGEMFMDYCFDNNGYQRLSNNTVTNLDQPTHHGLDGVYVNLYNEFAVGEAKYGTSQLGYTQHGQQMSNEWIINGLINEFGITFQQNMCKKGFEKYIVRVATQKTANNDLSLSFEIKQLPPYLPSITSML